MSSIGKRNIDEILLALNMNTDIKVQYIQTTVYNDHFKKLDARFSLEFLVKKKIPNEEGKNKVKLMKYATEYFRSMLDVYKRLGELYQEQMELKELKKKQPRVRGEP